MVSVLTWGPAAPDVASTSSVFWMILMSVSRDSDRKTRPTSVAIFSGGSSAARSSPVMHSPAASAVVAALMAFARSSDSSLFVTIRNRVVSTSTRFSSIASSQIFRVFQRSFDRSPKGSAPAPMECLSCSKREVVPFLTATSSSVSMPTAEPAGLSESQ
jgi:hypothetical protein